MGLVDRVKLLANEKKMTISELERKTDLGNGTISRWDTRTPGIDKLNKVANFFDVSTDYLLGRTDKRRYYDLNDKDQNDIAIQAERLLEGLDENAETNYYGEPLDDDDKAKLHEAITLALSLTKVKAKKKFTPKKYRDNNASQ